MPYGVVQTQSAGTISTPTLPITMTSTVAGNTIKVMAGSVSTTAGITCTDNKGNTYTPQATGGGGTAFGTLFTCYNALGGVTTITLTYPDSNTHAAMAREYSSISSLDKKASSAATGTNPTSGNTATTTQTNEMVFGALVVNSNGLTAPTVGAGFTNFVTAGSPFGAFNVAMEDKAVVGLAAYAANFTDTNSTPYFCVCLTDTYPSTRTPRNDAFLY